MVSGLMGKAVGLGLMGAVVLRLVANKAVAPKLEWAVPHPRSVWEWGLKVE